MTDIDVILRLIFLKVFLVSLTSVVFRGKPTSFRQLLSLCLPSCIAEARYSLPRARCCYFSISLTGAHNINKTPDAILGYFGLEVIPPIAILLLKLLTLTKTINYKFSLCVNIVLPSKVRAHADMHGRRWAVTVQRLYSPDNCGELNEKYEG